MKRRNFLGILAALPLTGCAVSGKIETTEKRYYLPIDDNRSWSIECSPEMFKTIKHKKNGQISIYNPDFDSLRILTPHKRRCSFTENDQRKVGQQPRFYCASVNYDRNSQPVFSLSIEHKHSRVV